MNLIAQKNLLKCSISLVSPNDCLKVNAIAFRYLTSLSSRHHKIKHYNCSFKPTPAFTFPGRNPCSGNHISLKRKRFNYKGKSTPMVWPISCHPFSSSAPTNKPDKDDDLKDTYQHSSYYPSASKPVVLRAMAGNSIITILKFLAWMRTGSSAILSEAIHSLVDTGNQGLLVMGLHQASSMPDKDHQYGYGKAAYFWSLISALGMFWLGAGVTIAHGIDTLFHPPEHLNLTWEAWGVLCASFLIDGYVLQRVVRAIHVSKPKSISFLDHAKKIKDPFVMAVLLEDASACTGVIIAIGGIGATYITGNPMWDSLASIGIGGLLGGVAVSLIRMNQRYLLGHSVEPEMERAIKKLLVARPAIDNVYSVQSQWLGPSAFSYKAEVDFDGTYLAARLLKSYKTVIMQSTDLEKDLPLILAWFAEDITRLVEKEVKEAEAAIRIYYPEAAFIELEPDSKDTELPALSNMSKKPLRDIEREAMTRALADLARTLERSAAKDDTQEQK